MKLLTGIASAFLIVVFLSSCNGVYTTSPNQVYEYWTGELPDSNVHVLNGMYQRKDGQYALFLKMEASEEWRKQLIESNKMEAQTEYTLPKTVPSWFKPATRMLIWKPATATKKDNMLFFEDTLTGKVLYLEVKL
ncbi:hypothetical protein HHL16_08745 [Pseudoflavitalea sp. G-6-1-2]|uniref:hypothetical protein n=1 Tax=Pseudoflavitalea sp. G-6-1-2 TaxID=2728841 RepID=UPI001469FC92|nr:hypothetical protein [Pseudoflavitalea sp. G-6-1-2]NML20959.1 hypothetical protein [Pseudoflavitalea sp. G-6-1-2]